MIELYKKRGETPLEALERLREESPEYAAQILSYAGRLDPMAEGILPVLVGPEENKSRADFLKKDKEYRVEFLLGVSTDTGDVLGIVERVISEKFDVESVVQTIEAFDEITEQTYPWYSSKTINGIPLFEYARKKDFSVERPVRDVRISDIHDIQIRNVSVREIVEAVTADISSINGDFRQEESVLSWTEASKNLSDPLSIVAFTLRVSSGTYIRALVETIFEKTGVPAVVYRLIRTKVF